MRKKSRNIKVTLRFRLLESGKVSLYLDYYPPIIDVLTGSKTRREYLGMFVIPIKKRTGELLLSTDGSFKYSPTDNETIRIAEIIRNNRQNELDKAEIFSDEEKEILQAKEKSRGDFISYFDKLASEKSDGSRANWTSTLIHLKSYLKKSKDNDTIRFCDITLEWCDGFKKHLLSAKRTKGDLYLSNNTASSYFSKFQESLKSAYKFGYLPKDLNINLSSIKEQDTQREFLTLDELKSLFKTPCEVDVIKRAALFSALTGFRHSDISTIKWNQIINLNGQSLLRYKINKTGKFEDMPLSEQALFLCGDRIIDDDYVFKKLLYSASMNKVLEKWIDAAGIKRKITFHCFRHTFATLQLANGTQITTIQKMLGHKSLQTTMIYAKTIEEAKRDAVDKIKIF